MGLCAGSPSEQEDIAGEPGIPLIPLPTEMSSLPRWPSGEASEKLSFLFVENKFFFNAGQS